MRYAKIFAAAMIFTLAASCARPTKAAETAQLPPAPAEDPYITKLRAAMKAAETPPEYREEILAAPKEVFLPRLEEILEGDGELYRLVDKRHPFVPPDYFPKDLVELSTTNGSFRVSREGLLLRLPAAEALEEMSAAAKRDGVTLVASSTFRSYAYQKEVYERNVRESGQKTADRESARPGYSQHQTGLVIDFGSISDDFAKTKAGIWLSENAGDYGWSLSFPQGYEAVTGYRWECWHYRYVGKPLVRFIDRWFGGVQQYALLFIHEWLYNDGTGNDKNGFKE